MQVPASRIIPRFGPLTIAPADWKMLVRHVRTFTRDFSKALKDLQLADPAFLTDTFFVIVKEKSELHRLTILPVAAYNPFIGDWVEGTPNVRGFGIVKCISNIVSATEKLEKSSKDGTYEERDFRRLAVSVVPTTADVKLSVEIDKRLGKPVYFIIMNPKFEYEVYKSPANNLYSLMKVAKDEDEEIQP